MKPFAALGCYTGVETEPDTTEAATGSDPLAERLANGDSKPPRELVKRHPPEQLAQEVGDERREKTNPRSGRATTLAE